MSLRRHIKKNLGKEPNIYHDGGWPGEKLQEQKEKVYESFQTFFDCLNLFKKDNFYYFIHILLFFEYLANWITKANTLSSCKKDKIVKWRERGRGVGGGQERGGV